MQEEVILYIASSYPNIPVTLKENGVMKIGLRP